MKRLLCCLLALLLGACPALAEGHLTEEEWAMLAAMLASDENNPVPEGYRLSIRPRRGGINARDDEKWMTLLLMSTDAADPTQNFGRSDVLMLCAVQRETGEMRLLSLPEDAPVPVEELSRSLRLRYVNCFGGPLMTVGTLNRLLELNISRYCAVNFSAFADMVNALGGVMLTLSPDEAVALRREAGECLLSGAEALKFARLRRQEENGLRARRLMAAMLEQAMEATSMDGAMALAEMLLPALDTNLTTADLMDLMFALLGQEETPAISIRSLSAPLDEAARADCRAFLYEKGE